MIPDDDQIWPPVSVVSSENSEVQVLLVMCNLNSSASSTLLEDHSQTRLVIIQCHPGAAWIRLESFYVFMSFQVPVVDSISRQPAEKFSSASQRISTNFFAPIPTGGRERKCQSWVLWL